mgnify:CR=1 FL=1
MKTKPEALAQVIVALIDIVNCLDGDAGLEDDGCAERDTDQHVVPTGLIRDTCADRAA